MPAPRQDNRCRRGHLMDGHNIKRVPSSKYVSCRQCGRDAQKRRRDQAKFSYAASVERVKLNDRIKQIRAERKTYYGVQDDAVDLLFQDIQDFFDRAAAKDKS